jgi:hypothetical protein
MRSFSQIIDQDFGGIAKYADAVGLEYQTAAAHKARDNIPPEYWGRVVDAARTQNIDSITLETLQAAVRPRKRANQDAA